MRDNRLPSGSKEILTMVVFLLIIQLVSVSVWAADISGGLDLVAARQGADGSWDGQVRNTSEILNALKHFGRENTLAFNRGILWLRSVPEENSDILARKVEGLALTDPSGVSIQKLVEALVRSQRADGGWGDNGGVEGDALSTYLAVRALLSLESVRESAVDKGLAYLLSKQTPAGSWTMANQGKESVFLTASILSLLSDHRERVDAIRGLSGGNNLGEQLVENSPADLAVSWLLARQRAAGSWGEDAAGSIQESALSYLALLKNRVPPEALDKALAFLNGRLDPAKYFDDPYLTAVGLLALSTQDLPDLTVRSLQVNDERPILGDTVTIRVTAVNQGRKPSPSFHIIIELDGVPAGDREITGLGAGEEQDVQFEVKAGTVGNHEIKVRVDPAGAVAESTKANNEHTKTIEAVEASDLFVSSENAEILLTNGIPVPSDKLRPGMDVKVRAKVGNLGQKAAKGAQVRLVLAGRLFGFVNLPELAGNSDTLVESTTRINAAPGRHTLFVAVEPAVGSVDADRNNNEAFVNLVIGDTDLAAPLPPIGLSCSADENRNVNLAWALNKENDIAGYIVYRNDKVASLTAAGKTDIRPFPPFREQITSLPADYSLIAVDYSGNESARSQSCMIEDKTAPFVELTNPHEGDAVTGIIQIRGTAKDLFLKSYKAKLVKAPGALVDFVEGVAAVENGILGELNTGNIEAGSYKVVLEAEDYAGQISSASVTVSSSNVGWGVTRLVGTTDDKPAKFPSWSADESEIIFNWDTNVFTTVWKTRVATLNAPEQVTLSFAGDFDPSWEPVGAKRYLFSSNTGDGVRRLFVQPQGGTQRTAITTGTLGFEQAEWSYDGAKIVAAGSDKRIYTLNPDGTGIAAVTAPGGHQFPVWSPDRTMIAFQSKNEKGFTKIWTTNADGSDSKPVTFGDWNDYHPSYMSDGLRLVYVSDKTGHRELCVSDASGNGVPSRITSLGLAIDHPRASRLAGTNRVVFSAPDGVYLAALAGLPKADVTASVANGVAPLTVQFTVTTPDPALIALYEWDFDNDGDSDFVSKTTGNASFTYPFQDKYQAKLRVVDINNRELVKFTEIIVRGPPEITVKGVPDGRVFYAAAVPTVSIRDDNLKMTTLKLDGADFVSGSSVTAEGFHTLEVRAEDLDGFVSTKSSTFAVGGLAEIESFDVSAPNLSSSSLSWSPDGRKIAYVANGQIFVTDAKRLEAPRQVTPGTGENSDPVWSPDGARIAFTSKVSATDQNIWIINADGTGLRQLTFSADKPEFPTWSPDGKRVAFSAGSQGHIRAVDVGTLEIDTVYNRLLNPGFRWARDPDWSRSTGRIVARFFDFAEKQWKMGVLDPAVPVEIVEIPNEDKLLHPSWSPDGTHVVAAEEKRNAQGVVDRRLIKIVSTSGGQPLYLTQSNFSGEPAWSPDGRRVAYREAPDNSGVGSSKLRVAEINTRPLITEFRPKQNGVSAPASVSFECAVHDFFGGRAVSFSFDFEGDGIIDLVTDTCVGISHTYTSGGGFVPVMRVTDNQGAVAEKMTAVTVVGAPTLSIRNVSDKGSYFGFVAPEIFIADDNPTFQEIRLDGSSYVSGTPVTASGPHDLYVRVQDASGNAASSRVFFYIAKNEAVEIASVDLGNAVAGATPLWLDSDTNLIVQILNGVKNGFAQVNVKTSPVGLRFITPAEDNAFSPGLGADRRTLVYHKTFTEAPFSRIVGSPIEGAFTMAQITDNLTAAKEASVSADGRWMAYVRDGGIYILNMYTGNSKRIAASPGTDQQPRFSPKGDALAFSSNRSGNFDIYVYRMASGDVAQITSGQADDPAAAWSLDGTKLYFHSVIDGRGQLFAADPEARVAPVQLFSDEGNNVFPSASPDGIKVAYVVSGKLRIVGPRSDFTGPEIRIDTPAASAVLTTVADVVVTTSDSDVAKVVLNARLQRESQFRKFDEVAVPAGDIQKRFALKLNTNSLPDGSYLVQAAATDRFDNAGNAVVEAVVNNHLPDLTGLSFKVLTDIGGSDAVSTVRLAFQLSEEARVEAAIKTRDGTAVKTIKTGFLVSQAGSDQTILWDQRNAFGSIVNEDTYVFELRVVDRADSEITVRREFRVPGFFRPVSAISSGGTPVTVSIGDVMRVRQADASGVNVLERAASDVIFVWDGRDRFGAISPVGTYKATVNNGPEISIRLEEDAVSPTITYVSLTDSIFAPLAGETVSVSYRTNEYCPSVLIQFQAEGNKSVKEFVRKGSLSFGKNDTVTWDGIDINNNVTPPGKYTVTIQATDAAGNRTSASGGAVTVDGPPKIVSVKIDTPAVISPNGDFVDDTLGIQIRVSEPVTYDVMIYSASNVLVENIRGEISSGTGLAVWEGRTGPDRTPLAAGFYNVAVEVQDRDGLTARNGENFIEIVSVPPIGAPEITEVNDFPDPFSPNGDNVADELNISYKVSDLADVIIRIFNSSNLLVRKLIVPGVSGTVMTVWNGRDGAEQVVPNGLYTYRIQAEKNNGRLKSLEKEGQALVFVPPVDPGPAISALRISPDPFSPNNDGQDDVTNVAITLTASATVTVDVIKGGTTLNRLADGVSAPQGESVYTWDGKAGGVVQADGVYTVRVTAVDAKGFKTTLDGSVQINTLLVNDAPIVSGVSAVPRVLFSDGDTAVDSVTVQYQLTEDATVNVVVKNDTGDVVLRNALVNKAGPNSILWDGADTHGTFLPYGTYRIELTAVDRFGLTSAARNVGVTQKSFLPDIFDPVVEVPGLISPDGDGVLDALGMTFFLSEPAAFTIGVVNKTTQQKIAVISGAGVEGTPPNRMVWDGTTTDGTRPAAGQYFFTLDAIDADGSEAEQKRSVDFTVDYPPKIESATAKPGVFSPNNDLKDDVGQFVVTSDKSEFSVTIKIYSSNVLVHTLANNVMATSGQFTRAWTGRGDDGQIVNNGLYRFEIQLTDATHTALKSPIFTGIVEVDNPLELQRLFQSASCFTPNGNPNDGADVLKIEYTINLRALAIITIFDASNKPVKKIADNEYRERGIDNTFEWNGTNDVGAPLPDGFYRIDFHFSEDNAIDTSITVCKLRRSPLAVIDFPAEEEVVSGNVVIKGFAAAVDQFDRYEVLVGFEDTSQSPPVFVTMKTLSPKTPTTQVFGGELAEWSTPQLKNARYVVRVNVRTTSGATGTDTAGVVTSNVSQLPFNVVTPVATTPVRSSMKFVTGKVGWSPDGNRLVFENDGKLSLINIDGSGLTTLSTGSASEEPVVGPVWDNQANQIVFHKGNAGDALFIRPPAGTVNTPINVGQAVPIAGDVSSDGTKVVFTATVGANNPEIFIVNTNGSGLTRITNNGSFEDNPTFSPDGKKIAFSSNMAGGASNFDIWVYDTTNGVFMRLTEDGGNELFPSWSNDGRQVLYEGHE